MNKNLPYRVVDCKFWIQGRCLKGDNCTFKHTAEQLKNTDKSTNTLPYKTVPCTFWAHGKCLKGDKCTFKHVPFIIKQKNNTEKVIDNIITTLIEDLDI